MDNLSITTIFLKELIDGKEVKILREVFDEFNIVDLAEHVDKLEINDILFILKVIRKEITGELFTYLDSETQSKVIDVFTSNEIRSILDNMYTDDVVDVMGELPANLVKKVLQSATSQQRDELNTILSFKPGTAGYLMSTDFVELKDTDTVGSAIRRIKRQGKVAETISYCYITSKRKLVGTISLREILFENEDEMICDLMNKDVICVKTDSDQEEVAYLASKYDILVIPVVNDEECLIGIITVDDILDVIEEEVTEDIQKMAAIVPVEDSYLKTSVWDMAKSRLPWLCGLMITATLTGSILAEFENALAAIPALSSFVPMIMGTAGNAGSQASIMVIRGISVDGLTFKNIWEVLWKELRVGVLCGMLLFAVVLARMMLLPPDVTMKIAGVIAVSMLIAMIVAKMVGGLLPLIAESLHQDPAAMAAPLITTIVDTLALLIYFVVSVKILGI